MDLSDGLADAVRQIAAASRTGATIDAAALPIPAAAREWFRRAGRRSDRRAPRPAATTTSCSSPCRGGRAGGSPPSIRQARGVPITRIGELTKEPAIGAHPGRRRGTPARRVSSTSRADEDVAPHPPLARPAASHARHAAADGAGLRARRVLRVLPVPRPPHRPRARLSRSPSTSIGSRCCSGSTRTCPGSCRPTTRWRPCWARRSCGSRSRPNLLRDLQAALADASWADFRQLGHALTPLAWAYVLGSTIGAVDPGADRLSRRRSR